MSAPATTPGGSVKNKTTVSSSFGQAKKLPAELRYRITLSADKSVGDGV